MKESESKLRPHLIGNIFDNLKKQSDNKNVLIKKYFMVDNIIMHILNINMNNISNLNTYGLKDKNNNVTNIIKNIVTNKYNNKIYIFKLKITTNIKM